MFLMQLYCVHSSVNLVQNVGDVLCRGSGDRSPPSGVQGQSLSRGSGGRSPPEGEAILDFYMHNFDLILNYFSPTPNSGGDVSPPSPQGLRLYVYINKREEGDVPAGMKADTGGRSMFCQYYGQTHNWQ